MHKNRYRLLASGFTLVELVCVITVLATLAASAMPRFANIQVSARKAALKTMKGALESNAMMLHSKCLLTDGCDFDGGVFMADGDKNWGMYRGYPDAGDDLNNYEIDAQISYSGFTASISSRNTHVFKLDSSSDPDNCYVKYVEVAIYGLRPTVTTVESGC